MGCNANKNTVSLIEVDESSVPRERLGNMTAVPPPAALVSFSDLCDTGCFAHVVAFLPLSHLLRVTVNQRTLYDVTHELELRCEHVEMYDRPRVGSLVHDRLFRKAQELATTNHHGCEKNGNSNGRSTTKEARQLFDFLYLGRSFWTTRFEKTNTTSDDVDRLERYRCVIGWTGLHKMVASAFTFRVILNGLPRSGKTTLVNRLIDEQETASFNSSRQHEKTQEPKIHSTKFRTNHGSVKYQIQDMPGTLAHDEALSKLNDADAILVVTPVEMVDLTDDFGIIWSETVDLYENLLRHARLVTAGAVSYRPQIVVLYNAITLGKPAQPLTVDYHSEEMPGEWDFTTSLAYSPRAEILAPFERLTQHFLSHDGVKFL